MLIDLLTRRARIMNAPIVILSNVGVSTVYMPTTVLHTRGHYCEWAQDKESITM